MLALGRTMMANERTLLSFVRTSLGLLGGGIALIKFLEHPGFVALGWILVVASVVFLIWGIKRYRYIKRLLQEAHAELSSTFHDKGKG